MTKLEKKSHKLDKEESMLEKSKEKQLKKIAKVNKESRKDEIME